MCKIVTDYSLEVITKKKKMKLDDIRPSNGVINKLIILILIIIINYSKINVVMVHVFICFYVK